MLSPPGLIGELLSENPNSPNKRAWNLIRNLIESNRKSGLHNLALIGRSLWHKQSEKGKHKNCQTLQSGSLKTLATALWSQSKQRLPLKSNYRFYWIWTRMVNWPSGQAILAECHWKLLQKSLKNFDRLFFDPLSAITETKHSKIWWFEISKTSDLCLGSPPFDLWFKNLGDHQNFQLNSSGFWIHWIYSSWVN